MVCAERTYESRAWCSRPGQERMKLVVADQKSRLNPPMLSFPPAVVLIELNQFTGWDIDFTCRIVTV